MRERDREDYGMILGIMSGFAAADMDRDAARMLVWLNQGELSARPGLPIRDLTRRVPNRAFTAYTVARRLADAGLITTPPGWDSGIADISLTTRGRACIHQYGGNVNQYNQDHPVRQPDITIGDVGEGAAVNLGAHGVAAAKHATVNSGHAAQQSTSGVDSGDLIAVLSLIRASMPMQSDQGFMDETVAEAEQEQDTPTLRRRLWERIVGYIETNGIERFEGLNNALDQLTGGM
ncbi:hypothetical protein [Streptomyces decoyicus]|uniref:hypothetical protein n=1 Tax=Streptomyces decoyicus TaxID=249567 RepID=UPI0038661E2F